MDLKFEKKNHFLFSLFTYIISYPHIKVKLNRIFFFIFMRFVHFLHMGHLNYPKKELVYIEQFLLSVFSES